MATQTFFWGGQWWKPQDKAAFAKWLSSHGASFAGWSKNHPQLATRVFGGPAAASPSGAAPLSVADWAGQQYDASIKPAIDSIEADRAKSEADSKARMQNVQGIYSALAGMLGSVGPQISQNYESAANTELAAGRGFGDQEAARGTAEGDKAAGYLTAAGAPQAAIEGVKAAAGGQESGNVVYGMGGYIPATSTAREGAAFASAGSMLPQTATGQGQLLLRGALDESTKANADFDSKIAELKAGRAEGIQKIIQDFMANDRAERALRLQEGYLGNTQRTTTAKLTGVDPATGQPTYESVYDAAKIKADAAKARQAQNSKNASAKVAGIKARENAFASARHSIFSAAAALPKTRPLTTEEVKAWMRAHPGAGPRQIPTTKVGTDYAKAKKALFNEYKDLLRYATAAGRPALKKRLNQMIDEALRAAGIVPKKPISPAGQEAWKIAGAGAL